MSVNVILHSVVMRFFNTHVLLRNSQTLSKCKSVANGISSLSITDCHVNFNWRAFLIVTIVIFFSITTFSSLATLCVSKTKMKRRLRVCYTLCVLMCELTWCERRQKPKMMRWYCHFNAFSWAKRGRDSQLKDEDDNLSLAFLSLCLRVGAFWYIRHDVCVSCQTTRRLINTN